MAKRKRSKKRISREEFPPPRPKFETVRVGRIPGYRKLTPTEAEAAGRGRRTEPYETPSGEIISKRQYLQLQREHFGMTVGRTSLERYRKLQEAEGKPSRKRLYSRAIDAYNRKYYKGKAKPGTVIANERFSKLWRTFERNRHVKGRRAFRAGADRAKALRAMGLLRVDAASGKWTSDPVAA